MGYTFVNRSAEKSFMFFQLTDERGTLACVTEVNSHDFALIAHERVFQSSFQEYPPKNGDCMEFVILSFCHFVIFSIFRGRLIYNI